MIDCPRRPDAQNEQEAYKSERDQGPDDLQIPVTGDLRRLLVSMLLISLVLITTLPKANDDVQHRKRDSGENESADPHAYVPEPQQLRCLRRRGIKNAHMHVALPQPLAG